jgi:hypothetical protein
MKHDLTKAAVPDRRTHAQRSLRRHPANEANEPAATVDSDDIGDVTEEQDEADVAGQFEHAHSGEDEPR